MTASCKRIFPLLFSSLISSQTKSQTIGTFNSIAPGPQTQNFALPPTHTFQRIIKTGDVLTTGETMGQTPDFTGYVPIGGSSTNGYLSISTETGAASCAVLSVSFNSSTRLWQVTNSGNVDLPYTELGYCGAFCSGAVTSKGTVLVSEEVAPEGDPNGDGYHDYGWFLEIDPVTRTVINQDGTGGADKLWAMGRQAHENVAVDAGNTVAYWGADNSANGFIYKFIPTVAGNFSHGTLYVLETNSSLGTGTWKQIANTTQVDRNNTIALSIAQNAYNFNRIEDVEIGPDGKIYFAATTDGRIYRFTDLGNTVSNLEVFVEKALYDVDDAGPLGSAQFEWPDNLAFDADGNLWVLEDNGNNQANHLWMVSPTHTTAMPVVKLFGIAPALNEPTGITFSPDNKFMFLSFQDHASNNTASQADAAGSNIVFNTGTTLVIARKEFLGSAALPLRFTDISLKKNDHSIDIRWKVDAGNDHAYFDVERSVDGIRFEKIGQNKERITAAKTEFLFTDDDPPAVPALYYRIKQCDANGGCHYSIIKKIDLPPSTPLLQMIPMPVHDRATLLYNATAHAYALFTISGIAGNVLAAWNSEVQKGSNKISLPVHNLLPGTYFLKIKTGDKVMVTQLVKMN